MSEKTPLPGNRAEYMTTDAFLLHTDVAVREFEMISRMRPRSFDQINPDLQPISLHAYSELPESTQALYFASSAAMELIPERQMRGGNVDKAFDSRNDITEEQLKRAVMFNTFDFGFADPEFTWHFAPAVAVSVVQEFVRSDVISSEDFENMTLTDWANIIGTGWFSDLMHSMAFTGNGVWGGFGNSTRDFRPDELRNRINRAGSMSIQHNSPLFELSQQLETETNEVYWTADLSREVKKELRGVIQDKTRTVGCPVARHGTRLHVDTLANDPHAKRLQETGHLRVGNDANPDDEFIRVSQEWSAIDIALVELAHKLVQYEQKYGQPQVNVMGTKFSHEAPKPSGVLEKLIQQKSQLEAKQSALV